MNTIKNRKRDVTQKDIVIPAKSDRVSEDQNFVFSS